MNGRADAVVDITDVVCPITFVKAKVAMEELTAGQILEVKINYRITRTLNNGDGTYTLLIEKAGLTK